MNNTLILGTMLTKLSSLKNTNIYLIQNKKILSIVAYLMFVLSPGLLIISTSHNLTEKTIETYTETTPLRQRVQDVCVIYIISLLLFVVGYSASLSFYRFCIQNLSNNEKTFHETFRELVELLDTLKTPLKPADRESLRNILHLINNIRVPADTLSSQEMLFYKHNIREQVCILSEQQHKLE